MAAEAAHFYEGRPITHLRCSPMERTQETMAPIAALFPELDVLIDEDVIEVSNVFVGQIMGSSGKAARSPKMWRYLVNPFRPSWGEPYAQIADRMTRAVFAANQAADDGEAVIVSHQLAIWVTRLLVEGKHLWHDPRKRQCTLASITSFHITDGVIEGFEYAEPVAHLLPKGPRHGF